MRPVNYVILHHSASSSGDAATFRNWHVNNNGWKDIGYHLVILNGHRPGRPFNASEVGKSEPGRPIEQDGAHCPGRNHDSVGICLVGNFMQEAPDPTQWQAAVEATVRYCKQYGIPVENVRGHKEEYSTSCPGYEFDLDKFRAGVAAAMGAQPPSSEADDWAQPAWKWALDAGLLDGTRPKDQVTREEMAVVLQRLFDLVKG